MTVFFLLWDVESQCKMLKALPLVTVPICGERWDSVSWRTCLKGLGKVVCSCWCKFMGTQLQASCLFSAYVRVHFSTVVSLPGHLSAMRSHCKLWVLAQGVWTAKAVLLVDLTSVWVKPHRLFSSCWAMTFTHPYPNPLCCSFFISKSLICYLLPQGSPLSWSLGLCGRICKWKRPTGCSLSSDSIWKGYLVFSWDQDECRHLPTGFYLFVHFPGGTSGKEPTCQSRRRKRRGFDPWVRKISWRRARQPTPVFLPGESHAGYSP